MATLAGRAPKDTYGNLLNIDNANTGLDATVRQVQDGEGTGGPVGLSTTVLRVLNGSTLDFQSGGAINFANATVSNLSGVLANVVEDKSPELGADLDCNSFDLLFDNATGLYDDSNNEQMLLYKTASAVNFLKLTNSATGSAPKLQSAGDDTNISFSLGGKGTGTLAVCKGSDDTARVLLDVSAVSSKTDRTVTFPDANVDLTLIGTAYQQGLETIYIPAAAMKPTITAGCAALTTVEVSSTTPNLTVLDFDAATDENAQFSLVFPKRWNKGTVTFVPYFTSAGTNSGSCIWGLKAVAVSDDDPIGASFGTAQTSTKAHSGVANDLDVGPESSALTIAGTPANHDCVVFNIYRDADNASDTLTGDARLLGVRLMFTTNANTDT